MKTSVDQLFEEIKTKDRTFIVFEAGPTHTGIASAIQLVELAKRSGADAIKFQVSNPERLIFDRKQMFSYGVLLDKKNETYETVTEPLFDILKRRVLNREEWLQLKHYCDKLGIEFFATASFSEDIDFLIDLGCKSVKIASADVTHTLLLEHVAKSDVIVQVDTGSSTLGEIEAAVNIISESGNHKVIIHHCPSGYPASLDNVNLRMIGTLQAIFPELPIAFSDHSPGWEMDIAARSLGARLIEKTITLDRTTRSAEHVMSLELDSAVQFVKSMRQLDEAMGFNRRPYNKEANDKAKLVRRSIFISETAKKGTPLKDCSLEFKRPGTGIPVDKLEFLEGAILKRDLTSNHKLSLQDLTWE